MTTPQTERFRKNLAFLCEGYGRGQVIAKKAGITNVHLSRIIHGKSIPKLDVASELADAVGVPLSDLLKKTLKKLAVSA